MFDLKTVYCDNLSNIQLAKNPVFHARTKHIEVHYHFVRARVLSGEVELRMFRRIDRTPTFSPSPLVSTSCGNFQVCLGPLWNLDVSNLRGRADRKDHQREQERSGSARDAVVVYSAHYVKTVK